MPTIAQNLYRFHFGYFRNLWVMHTYSNSNKNQEVKLWTIYWLWKCNCGAGKWLTGQRYLWKHANWNVAPGPHKRWEETTDPTELSSAFHACPMESMPPRTPQSVPLLPRSPHGINAPPRVNTHTIIVKKIGKSWLLSRFSLWRWENSF